MNPNARVLGELRSELLVLLDESELRIDVFRGAGPNGAALAVRITHIPTGFAETCDDFQTCLLYTSPSPRDRQKSRMPSSA